MEYFFFFLMFARLVKGRLTKRSVVIRALNVFTFFAPCIVIQLLQIRPAKCRQYNVLICKTSTCFGPHCSIIREYSYTKQSLDQIIVSNRSPVVKSSMYDLLQLHLYFLQHLYLNFMTLVLYLF